MPVVHGKNIKTLYSAEDIQSRIEDMAQQIAAQNSGSLLVLPVLKGSFVFAADLIRALYKTDIDLTVEFITVSSYGAGKVSGKLTVLQNMESDVEGRDVLLVDDILETGKTLNHVKELLISGGARRVFVCTLVDKAFHREAPIEADFVGFDCPDLFIVGYGMDFAHKFRQLPFIGVIEE